jgi:hypothetical protein
MLLAGCTTTSMQGYADRDLPAAGVRKMATYVAAPVGLATSMLAGLAEEGRSHGVVVEDAMQIVPPTRTYSDAEVRNAMAKSNVDALLVVNVADSGVQAQYAGTIFQARYNGSSSYTGAATRFGNAATVDLTGTHSGTMIGSSTPTFRYSRQTSFSARLIDTKTGRTLWVGTGQVNSRGGNGLIGRLMVSDGVSSSNSIRAIFDDLQKKGLIGPTA